MLRALQAAFRWERSVPRGPLGGLREVDLQLLHLELLVTLQIKCNETKVLTTILHEPGYVIYMPDPMNSTHTHSIPKLDCRISLTFREITTPTNTPPAAARRRAAQESAK